MTDIVGPKCNPAMANGHGPEVASYRAARETQVAAIRPPQQRAADTEAALRRLDRFLTLQEQSGKKPETEAPRGRLINIVV